MKKTEKRSCSAVLDAIGRLQDDSDAERIEQVAADLERTNYEPIFLITVDGFLRMKQADVAEQARQFCQMSDDEILAYNLQHRDDPDTIIEEQLNMLLRNFRLLVRLRADEPEAWDEVHELYEDD